MESGIRRSSGFSREEEAKIENGHVSPLIDEKAMCKGQHHLHAFSWEGKKAWDWVDYREGGMHDIFTGGNEEGRKIKQT